MRGDFHVRFCERFGLKCPDLLDLLVVNILDNSVLIECKIRLQMRVRYFILHASACIMKALQRGKEYPGWHVWKVCCVCRVFARIRLPAY